MGCVHFSFPLQAYELTHLHALQGHILYPAAIAMSRFLELHAEQLLRPNPSSESGVKGKGKAVIELGAGGGLPGLVAALEGAEKVRRARRSISLLR